jgi:hypothetical protein
MRPKKVSLGTSRPLDRPHPIIKWTSSSNTTVYCRTVHLRKGHRLKIWPWIVQEVEEKSNSTIFSFPTRQTVRKLMSIWFQNLICNWYAVDRYIPTRHLKCCWSDLLLKSDQKIWYDFDLKNLHFPITYPDRKFDNYVIFWFVTQLVPRTVSRLPFPSWLLGIKDNYAGCLFSKEIKMPVSYQNH